MTHGVCIGPHRPNRRDTGNKLHGVKRSYLGLRGRRYQNKGRTSPIRIVQIVPRSLPPPVELSAGHVRYVL
jgi:hypothetical protein